jgi:hypothetical protein
MARPAASWRLLLSRKRKYVKIDSFSIWHFVNTDINSSNLSKPNKVRYIDAHIQHHKHKQFNWRAKLKKKNKRKTYM